MKRYKYNFGGKLFYNQDAEYEIKFRNGYFNFSGFLNRVYLSDNKFVNIKIMNGCKLMFEEEGFLYCAKNKCGFESYHVAGVDLDGVLFNLVDEDIEIFMYANAFEGDSNGTTTNT